MGKTKRKPIKSSTKNVTILDQKPEFDQIISHAKSEMEFHIEKWEALVNDKIKKLKHEMHTVISSLPSDIAKMSVQDYITNFVEPNEKSLNDIGGETLKEIGNLSNGIPVPSGSCMKDSIKLAPSTTKSRTRKKVPATTRSTRSRKNFETLSKCPFVMVEGTPMLTRKDTSHLNLTEKPRKMTNDDQISAVKLSIFSDRGSPMMMETMDENIKRKIQESIQAMMNSS